MHPFHRTLTAVCAAHVAYGVGTVSFMLWSILVGDYDAMSRYQMTFWGLFFGLRAIGHVVLENVMQKTSGVFRSIPATRRMDTLTMMDQFVTCFSWIPMALWLNVFLLVNPVSYSNNAFAPTARFCAGVCVIDLITELYRNPPRELYAHHAVAITMLLASFEFMPSSYSDIGVVLYSLQSALDRASYLVFFWGRMRGCADKASAPALFPMKPAGEVLPTATELSPKVSLRFAKSSSNFSTDSLSGTYFSCGDFAGEMSSPLNSACREPNKQKGEDVSMDDLIPATRALRGQFTIAFVYYTFIVRGLMLISSWTYLYRNSDEIPFGWRIVHLVLPWMFNAADWHLYQHLYQRSTLCMPRRGNKKLREEE